MARERQLEGSAIEESQFSDAELDENGDPIEENEEEEESELDDDARGGGREDRGDNVLDDNEEEEEPDLEALEAVSAAGRRSVPIDRLNEVLAENTRLRGVIEQVATTGPRQASAPAAAPAAPVFDLKAKLKERADAILEGDTDKIVALDEEIEEYRNTTVRQQGEQAGRQAATQAYQADRMQEIVNAAFTRYPFLNDGHADFNKEALDDVLMYKNRYIAEGESASAALKRAVNRVCPFYAEELYGDDRPTGKKKANGKSADDDEEGGKRDPNARDPKKVLRNARAGNRVPPNLGRNGTGNGAARRDMSERSARDIPASELRDMSEEERKRLRGDYV